MARDYETFVVPDDVGGRYSILTAVGLLPIAVAGVDIRELMRGAKDAMKEFPQSGTLPRILGYQYAAAAQMSCCAKATTSKIMVNYEPSLHFFTEW